MTTHSEAGLLSATAETALERWYLPQEPPTAAHKGPLHDQAADHIGRDKPLRYLEFGVHEGWSIRKFASIFKHPEATFTGFDSFVGLPEQWGQMQPGHFSTKGRVPAIEDSRVGFVTGWFQNSVPEVFPGLAHEPLHPTLVHFDADLYSSTLFLLTSLWWHVPQYYFIFDEFMGHEMAATRHFLTAYPAEIKFILQTKSPAQVPAVVFGHMRRTRMSVTGMDTPEAI